MGHQFKYRNPSYVPIDTLTSIGKNPMKHYGPIGNTRQCISDSNKSALPETQIKQSLFSGMFYGPASFLFLSILARTIP